MEMKDFTNLLKDADDVVNDYNVTELKFLDTSAVPCIEDDDLTFGDGVEKKGKHIKTCVLYVDIRNSVELTHRHSITKMGKIFSTFTRCVQMAAIKSNGRIRNIIGDRVMVVFPEENCFQNAVECAISINHLMKNVLNKKFYGIDFQCGIGIDYGDMYCIKVGMPKRDGEREDNRRLVWVGLPANHASRLTDFANKEYSELRYRVRNYFRKWTLQRNTDAKIYPIQSDGVGCKEDVMTADEAVNNILDGKSIQIEPLSIVEPYRYNPILLSEDVFYGFKKACPNDNSILKGWWKPEERPIKDIQSKVYGANLKWEVKE